MSVHQQGLMTVVTEYPRPEEQTYQDGDRWHRPSVIVSDDSDLDGKGHTSSHTDDQDFGYVYGHLQDSGWECS